MCCVLCIIISIGGGETCVYKYFWQIFNGTDCFIGTAEMRAIDSVDDIDAICRFSQNFQETVGEGAR